MRAATAWSTSVNTEEAVSVAYAKVQRDLGQVPDWLAIHTSVEHDSSVLINTLHRVAPGVPVHGGTSCLGVMTEEGFHTADGVGLGLFGLSDPSGHYGVGAVGSGLDPRAARAVAAREALAAAGCPGKSPQLVWLTCAPGAEEEVIKGIEDTVGPNIPIAGGSAADNTIEGHWSQFANGEVYSSGVVVTAMFPSTGAHSFFWSGYYTTEHRGTVTQASGRTIHTIDNRPAAEVYNEWTYGSIGGSLGGGNVLADTTLHPIGRRAKKIGGGYFPSKMRIIDTRAKLMYGHSTSLRREVNDRTDCDTNLLGGNTGCVVGWRASASACSRVEAAAEKVADETKSIAKAQKGETV